MHEGKRPVSAGHRTSRESARIAGHRHQASRSGQFAGISAPGLLPAHPEGSRRNKQGHPAGQQRLLRHAAVGLFGFSSAIVILGFNVSGRLRSRRPS